MQFYSKIRLTSSALLISTAASFLPSTASAFDAENLIKRYQKLSATQGQTFTYSAIESTGDDSFILRDPNWKIATVAEIKAKSLTFNGIQEGENGSLTISSLNAESVTSGSPDVVVTFDNAVMKGLKIPGTGESDPIQSMMFYTRFELGKGAVSAEGKTIATMGGAYIDVSPFDATTPMKMVSEITDINIDTSAIPDKKFQKVVADLGYGAKFKGRIAMDANWSLSDGVMDLHKYHFVIDEVGTFSMPFSIGGYTAAKMKQMQKMNETMKDKSEQEKGIAAMALFADLTLRSMSISFKDDSLTNRGLKYASKQMGQPPEQLATMAPIMIGAGMGQLQMPEVTKMVSQAVSTFLANPGTFSVSVKPSEPVPFMSLAAAGSADPKSLVKLLNLQVTAK